MTRRQKKRKTFHIVLFFAVCLLIGVCYKGCKRMADSEYMTVQEASGMLDGIVFSKEEWNNQFNDPQAILNFQELENIIERIGAKEQIQLQKKMPKSKVTREEWMTYYEQMVEFFHWDEQMEENDLFILAVSQNTIVTPKGEYILGIENETIERGKLYQCKIRGKVIFSLSEKPEQEYVLENVLIKNHILGKLTILYRNKTYHFSYQGNKLKEDLIYKVCNLCFQQGEIKKIQVKKDTISGKVLSVQEDYIEIEGYGKIKKEEYLPLYQLYDPVMERDIEQLVLANETVKCVVAKGKIAAMIFDTPEPVDTIRVLLTNESSSLYHDDINVISKSNMKLYDEKGNVIVEGKKFEQIIQFAREHNFNYLKIKPQKDEGTFCFEENGKKTNEYHGILEIRKEEQGYTLVNELSIEDYLRGVVPAEMPSSYHIEALKAQAVCARTYSYRKIYDAEYSAMGAHVDDTVNYQSYNKQMATKETNQAVNETAGEVLYGENDIGDVYYFSTSCGVTDDGSCWLDDPKQSAMLKSVSVGTKKKKNLNNEDKFFAFITSFCDSDYECGLPYYRWSTTIANAQENAVAKIWSVIEPRLAVCQQNFQYYDQNNQEKEITDFSSAHHLVSIKVIERTKSGCVRQIQITTDQGRLLISNEYNVRLVLGALCDEISLSDGSKKQGMMSLPSAFFALGNGENQTTIIYGGGFGHGVGMSQNGAQKLAEQGKSHKEILDFFFQNLEIKKIS